LNSKEDHEEGGGDAADLRGGWTGRRTLKIKIIIILFK
jgi:hypothetical protein